MINYSFHFPSQISYFSVTAKSQAVARHNIEKAHVSFPQFTLCFLSVLIGLVTIIVFSKAFLTSLSNPHMRIDIPW